MKITYRLDEELTEPERQMLDEILHRRPWGASSSDYELYPLFKDGEFRDMVSRYLRGCNGVDILNKNSDEYWSWRGAHSTKMRLQPILEGILESGISYEFDVTAFEEEEKEYSKLERELYGDAYDFF